MRSSHQAANSQPSVKAQIASGRTRRSDGAAGSDERADDAPLREDIRLLGRVLGEELAGLLGRDDSERYRSRLHRYRHLGRG